MEAFKEQVKKSFNSCKLDIEDLRIENTALKGKILDVQSQNSKLNSILNELISEIKGLKLAIDYIKDSKEQHQTVIEKETIKETPIHKEPFKQEVQTKQPSKVKDPYEALLAFKAKANKREMLKQKLISMVGESGMNLSELKFMFIEHFRYCSKATFYNYLKELELEKVIRIERENSKNYIYLNSISREI